MGIAVTLHRVSTKSLLRALEPGRVHRGQNPTQARLLGNLMLRPNALVPYADLADSVWGDDPAGGPENITVSFAVAANSLRQKGWPIVSIYNQGMMLRGAICPRCKAKPCN